jgi:NAD(P)-dependent dehydrogenase (short-subunit alcohol dehydrogenase family)
MKVLVIGGTGTIGKAVVDLLQENHDVVKVGYRDGDYQVDISSKESIQALFDKVGQVDAIVCTTGLANFGKFNELTDGDYALGLSNKLMGQVNVVRLGQHVLNPGGSITITIGVLGQEPIPGSTVVSLANGGLEGFIRAAALELQGIRINAVSPPFVKETMEMMGMDSSAGMLAADVAKTYKAVLEGEFHGETLDARKLP